jgi:glutaredoxin
VSPSLDIVIYSRPGCHLCETAEAAIRSLTGRHRNAEVRSVNVESDPALEDAYGQEIPVVSVNGGPAFPYRGDTGRLEREMARQMERPWNP